MYNILTVTLNPCIDKYCEVEDINYHDVVRLKVLKYFAGGKGINVSRTLNNLQIPNKTLTLIGKKKDFNCTSSIFSHLLKEEKIDYESIEINGDIRTNLTIFNKKNGKELKLNEEGPLVSNDIVDVIINKIDSLTNKNTIIAFCGSIPKGLSALSIIKIIRSVLFKVKYIYFDSDSEIVSDVIMDSEIDFIKPNIYEAERILERKIKNNKDIKIALKTLKENVRNPIISAGEKGIFFLTEENKFINIIPPRIKPITLTGAGDAFTAGFLSYLVNEKPLIDCLKFGVACGTARVLIQGPGLIFQSDALKILDDIKIKNL